MTANCAPFTMSAGIMPQLWSPKQRAPQSSFVARTTAGRTATMARSKAWWSSRAFAISIAQKGLSSVIEYMKYTIENFERACLQSSPLSSGAKSESGVAATRQGRAFYLWIYPNFMINAYEGVMDTNLVLPMGVDKCAVIF